MSIEPLCLILCNKFGTFRTTLKILTFPNFRRLIVDGIMFKINVIQQTIFTENEYGAQPTPYLTQKYMHMETNAFVFLNLLVDQSV